MRLRFALPQQAEELTVSTQKRLRLDKEKRLFPGPNHPGENHKEKPIGLPIGGSFDLSTEDDQLVP